MDLILRRDVMRVLKAGVFESIRTKLAAFKMEEEERIRSVRELGLHWIIKSIFSFSPGTNDRRAHNHLLS